VVASPELMMRRPRLTRLMGLLLEVARDAQIRLRLQRSDVGIY